MKAEFTKYDDLHMIVLDLHMTDLDLAHFDFDLDSIWTWTQGKSGPNFTCISFLWLCPQKGSCFQIGNHLKVPVPNRRLYEFWHIAMHVLESTQLFYLLLLYGNESHWLSFPYNNNKHLLWWRFSVQVSTTVVQISKAVIFTTLSLSYTHTSCSQTHIASAGN